MQHRNSYAQQLSLKGGCCVTPLLRNLCTVLLIRQGALSGRDSEAATGETMRKRLRSHFPGAAVTCHGQGVVRSLNTALAYSTSPVTCEKKRNQTGYITPRNQRATVLLEEFITMAKDGTQRGGSRVGAGRKGKSAVQRILDGEQQKTLHPEMLEDDPDVFIPDLPKWATEEQHMTLELNGQTIEVPELETERVYRHVYSFLDRLEVIDAIGPHLIQFYAFEVARYIQAEQIISKAGFTVPHPTTGAPIASPFITYSMAYLKQSMILWNQISQVVRDRWEGSTPSYGYGRSSDSDTTMEYLLTHNPRLKRQ